VIGALNADARDFEIDAYWCEPEPCRVRAEHLMFSACLHHFDGFARRADEEKAFDWHIVRDGEVGALKCNTPHETCSHQSVDGAIDLGGGDPKASLLWQMLDKPVDA
jgi:hypothetical protein